MENKKLIKIILKDMTELEELIGEVKNKGSFDSFEIEFLHTRAKGIQQLLQMISSTEPVVAPFKKTQAHEIFSENKEKREGHVSGNGFTDTKSQEKPVEKFYETDRQPEEVYDTPQEEESQFQEVDNPPREIDELVQEVGDRQPEAVEVENEAQQEILLVADEPKTATEEVEMKIKSNDWELEEENLTEANQRLGDSFLKEKSINDLVTEHNNLEFKLSNRPVESIQSAIGINDRFQFIRELFEGSGEKFSETVKTLDSMNHIREAVEYLQNNFKWKKNETSLKFVSLVKRRFPNE